MASITLGGNQVHTNGDLPKTGSKAPEFRLVKSDLSIVSLADFAGKKLVLNIFPSIDTGTCATSVRKFNEKASTLENTRVLCISRDLPFAQKRFSFLSFLRIYTLFRFCKESKKQLFSNANALF